MSGNNYVGNVSTLFKMLSMTFAGWILGVAVSKGLNLPIDAATLSECIFAILMFIAGYIDAKYPNTFKFLGNHTACTCNVDSEETVMNDEYETEGEV